MPEEQTTTSATEGQTTQQPAQATSAEPAKPEIDWKSEAQKWERRSKENFDKLAELAPLSKLAAALGDGDAAKGKSELEALAERQAGLEKTLAEERALRIRLEVASEKGLTHAQAARLSGATREEMVADADSLLALFPTTPTKPGTPAPDPSQGARGSSIDIDSRIAEAQKAGDVTMVISLQNQKMRSTN